MGFVKDIAKLTPLGLAASVLKGKDKDRPVRPTFVTSGGMDETGASRSLLNRQRPPHAF